MKQLKKIERKETKVPQNFMSDAFKFLDLLNQMNGKDQVDPGELVDGVNEFAASLVYFRESIDRGGSNIQALNKTMVTINQLVKDAGSDYSRVSASEATQLLENTMNEIIMHLNDMNDLLLAAEQDEIELKRIESIEQMFLSVQTDIQASDEIIKKTKDDLFNIEGSLNASADAIRDSVEVVDKKIKTIENQSAEFKTQCDKVVQTGTEWQKAFNEWKGASSQKTEECLNDLTSKLEKTQKVIEEKNDAELKSFSDHFDTAVGKIEKKGEDALGKIEKKAEAALDNIDDLVDRAKSGLSTEGFKQVFAMIGGGFSIVNFILIIFLLFIK